MLAWLGANLHMHHLKAFFYIIFLEILNPIHSATNSQLSCCTAPILGSAKTVKTLLIHANVYANMILFLVLL